MAKIAFNSANLVARVTGYKFTLREWGVQSTKTVEQTDEKTWREICREIAASGYTAIEVWEAHAAPEVIDEQRAKTWRAILDENNLTPIGYAGSFRPETVRVCQWLGISTVNGGARQSVEESEKLAVSSGVVFNHENHPEKSAAEIVGAVGGGSERLGVCVDTGWLGTQGVDAPSAIRELGSLIRHVHLKDVIAAGGHETCLLGEGVVNIAGCIQTLQEIGYDGWYSWEDEPENRNPFDSAAANREYIEKLLHS